ncbi:hypothetical protein G9272_00810 [Streptomyces asoensis]|uniref:Uncharacterized protein n=1 Tax=Streptomyces asoensis TaxID=249586 RepID=A0A6M4WGG3_9ACTN|nr:hypothetical protein [Streptomyces asoensis]QJS98901.1 hypothetical protein G9272_00810 [Streptomyces asoensis]
MSNQFDRLRTEQLLSALELRSGRRVDHAVLVRMLRQITDGGSGPRMSLLERLEQDEHASALPTTLRSALAASRPGQERAAVGAKVRYALVLASLPGALADFPSGLLRRLLDRGVWNAERARLVVAQVVEPRVRVLRLAELVGSFPHDHELAEDLYEAAARCASNDAADRRALSVALPLLSTQAREELVERILPGPDRGAGRERLACLLRYAAGLAPAHVREAEALIDRTARLSEDERLTAWALLYPVLAPEHRAPVLPRLLRAAAPDASPVLAAALLTLLDHTDGPSRERLCDFAATRHRVPRAGGASAFERAVALWSHRIAVSRFVPATLAGLLLGWSLESPGRYWYERAFLPLSVTVAAGNRVPPRQVRVAAVACAIAAPDRFRDAFPYDSFPEMAHIELRHALSTVLGGLPRFGRALARRVMSWVAAWLIRREGALDTEARGIDVLLRASVAREVRNEAEALDVLARLEAAEGDDSLEHDVRLRALSDIAGHLPDEALARAVRLLETRADASAISMAIARFLPHMDAEACSAYTALVLDRVMATSGADPEAACRVLTVLGDHLDPGQAASAWKAVESFARDTWVSDPRPDGPELPPVVAEACAALVPRVPTGLLPRARRVLDRCRAGVPRARGTAALACRAPGPRSTVSVLRTAATVLVGPLDPVETAMCLAVLRPLLPGWAGRWGVRHALRLLRKAADGTYEDGRCIPETLAELVRIDPEVVHEAMMVAHTVRASGLRAEAAVALLPHLGTEERQKSLDMIVRSVLGRPGLTDYGHLVSTARLLPWVRPPLEEFVQRLVDGVDEQWNAATRAAAFAALAESAPLAMRPDLVARGLTEAATVNDPDDRATCLVRLAVAVSEVPRYPAGAEWTALMSAGSRRPRSELLDDIGNLAPLVAAAGGPAAATEVCRALADVSRLWP